MASSSTSLADSTGTYDRGYVFRLAGTFTFGWALIGAVQIMINPLLPFVREEFHLSGVETGLLTWAFVLPYLLIQIPSGVFADRFGAKRVLVTMTLISAVAVVAQGLWSYGLIAFVGLAVVYCAGSGPYYPIAFGSSTGAAPASARGIVSSMLVTGMALGSGMGMGFAVPLAELGGGWRFPFLVIGLPMLLLPVIFQLVMRPTQRKARSTSGKFTTLFADRSLVLLFVVNMLTNIGYAVLMVWGPAFLGNERGFSVVVAAAYLALVNVIGFPAGMAVGMLSDRIGRKRLTVSLFAVAGVALALIGGLDQPVFVVAAIVVYGIAGKWTTDGALAAWMGDRVAARFPTTGSAVYGVNNTARVLGVLVAPPIAGAFLDRTGSLVPSFYFGAGILMIAAILLLLASEVREKA